MTGPVVGYEVQSEDAYVDSDYSDALVYFNGQSFSGQFWDDYNNFGIQDVQVWDPSSGSRLPAYVAYLDAVNKIALILASGKTLANAAPTTYTLVLTTEAAPAVTDPFGRNAVFDNGTGIEAAMNFIGSDAVTVEDMTGNGHDATVNDNANSEITMADDAAAFFGRGMFFDRVQGDLGRVTMADVGGDFDGDGDSLRTISWFGVANDLSGSDHDPWGTTNGNRARLSAGSYRLRLEGTDYLSSESATLNAKEVWVIQYDGPSDEARKWLDDVVVDTEVSVTDPWPSAGAEGWQVGNSSDTNRMYGGWFSLFLWRNSYPADVVQEVEAFMATKSDFWVYGDRILYAAGGAESVQISGSLVTAGSAANDAPSGALSATLAGSFALEVTGSQSAPGGALSSDLAKSHVELEVVNTNVFGGAIGAVIASSHFVRPEYTYDIGAEFTTGISLGAEIL